MIQAKDLRIGNWVMMNKPIKISVTNLEDLMFWTDHKNPYCKPIPITEEILFKCGFEKPANSFNRDIFHLTEWDRYQLNWCVAMNKNGAVLVEKLKYLHQLQNLYFALTGEELDIDLSR